MSKSSLFRAITGRMITWGVLGGVALGFVYVLLLFLFTQSNASLVFYVAFIGSVVGGFVGLVLGLINGLALLALALLVLPRLQSRTTFRAIVHVVNVLLTGSGAFYAFSGLATYFGLTGSRWLVFAVIPTIIALGVAWQAGVRVVRLIESSTAMATAPE